MKESKTRAHVGHPAALVLFLLFWTLSACLIDQPLPLLVMAGVFAALLLRLRPGSFFLIARIFIVFLPVLLLVNLLTSRSGHTPLLELPWGRTVMLEPMLFSGVMLIKVILVMAIFIVALSLGQRSEMIRWLIRHLPQTGILCAIALAGLPAIRDRFQRSAFVLECRCPEDLPRSRRLAFQFKLWMPLLHHVLGYAVTIADVLNARAWNTGPRSGYHCQKWSWSDHLLATSALAVFILTATGAWLDILRFPWQPDGLSPLFPLSPEILIFCLTLALPLLLTTAISFRHAHLAKHPS